MRGAKPTCLVHSARQALQDIVWLEARGHAHVSGVGAALRCKARAASEGRGRVLLTAPACRNMQPQRLHAARHRMRSRQGRVHWHTNKGSVMYW